MPLRPIPKPPRLPPLPLSPIHCEYIICSMLGLLRPLRLGTLRKVSLSSTGCSAKSTLGSSCIWDFEFLELPDFRLVCCPPLDSSTRRELICSSLRFYWACPNRWLAKGSAWGLAKECMLWGQMGYGIWLYCWLWREVELEGGCMQGIEAEGLSLGDQWRAGGRSIDEGNVYPKFDTEQFFGS